MFMLRPINVDLLFAIVLCLLFCLKLRLCERNKIELLCLHMQIQTPRKTGLLGFFFAEDFTVENSLRTRRDRSQL